MKGPRVISVPCTSITVTNTWGKGSTSRACGRHSSARFGPCYFAGYVYIIIESNKASFIFTGLNGKANEKEEKLETAMPCTRCRKYGSNGELILRGIADNHRQSSFLGIVGS